MTPPSQQDGVPGISGPPIAPAQSAEYDFPLTFSGTFWMHSHQGLQEQLLMSAPLIIHDDRDEPDQLEVVLMLHDFSFTPPEEIYAKLRKPMKMAGTAMKPYQGPDLNDVAYDAFLANDRTLADPQTIKVEQGGRVLLRVINGSAMSNFHLDLGSLDGELIAADGFRVKPVAGKTFPIAAAQRLEIRLRLPAGTGAYPVLAILEGTSRQTGIVLDAGGTIGRISDMAEKPEPAITLHLERRLEAVKPLPARNADRTRRLDLTGDMAKYVWSINNVVWTKDTPPSPR
jgi:FtsP/CotA-like multicopper oxidase with cupredoxin domain